MRGAPDGAVPRRIRRSVEPLRDHEEALLTVNETARWPASSSSTVNTAVTEGHLGTLPAEGAGLQPGDEGGPAGAAQQHRAGGILGVADRDDAGQVSGDLDAVAAVAAAAGAPAGIRIRVRLACGTATSGFGDGVVLVA
jgi:hypothetical protein